MGLNPKQRIPKGTRIPVSMRMRQRKCQIGRLHATITDQRRNHHHQLTATAVARAQVICIEDLNIKAMGRSMGRRAFRRSVGDAGLGEIRRQITYKAQWHGRTVSAVDRFYPSSKTCSACGAINTALILKDTTWTCGCGTAHDRDVNAAINIRREGLRLLAEPCPDGRPTGTFAGRTRRSRGTDARGGDTCATIKPSIARQPTPLNRELTYRAARPPTTRRNRDGPGPSVEG